MKILFFQMKLREPNENDRNALKILFMQTYRHLPEYTLLSTNNNQQLSPTDIAIQQITKEKLLVNHTPLNKLFKPLCQIQPLIALSAFDLLGSPGVGKTLAINGIKST